ncbi:MAG: XRE family transcriptional regulator [Candidatus Thiodiazotropha sp. LLP2]
MTMTKRYKSVFDAIADTPEEALNMKLRTVLMREIVDIIESNHWTQKEAAKHLGVTQPRISDLQRGKLSLFSLDTLVNMVAATGGSIDMKVAK